MNGRVQRFGSDLSYLQEYKDNRKRERESRGGGERERGGEGGVENIPCDLTI